jgi:hypothetical protein
MSDNLEELVQDDDLPFDLDVDVDDTHAVGSSQPVVQTNIQADGSLYLNKDKFAAFFNTLNILKIQCEDLVVQSGKICQLNNRKSAIYVIDLNTILGDISFQISGIIQKYELLFPFKMQSVDVSLQLTDTSYLFKDSVSKIEFRKPSSGFLTNQYIESNELINRLNISNDKVFEYKMNKSHINRLNAYSKALSATTLKIKFSGDNATLYMIPADSSVTTEVTLLTITDELEESLDGVMNIPIDAFVACAKGS